MITNKQYKRLMSEYEKTGKIVVSAMKADVDPQTARKYIEAGKRPAELQAKHTWRTRPDPLAEDLGARSTRMLREAPELEAKTLFEYFLARPDSGLEGVMLRTFFRRVRHWRATQGPEREVFFAQEHARAVDAIGLDLRPGVAGDDPGRRPGPLSVIAVLPYSDWQWATPVSSRSRS